MENRGETFWRILRRKMGDPTQVEMANKLGISVDGYRHLEQGQTAPTIATAQKAAQVEVEGPHLFP